MRLILAYLFIFLISSCNAQSIEDLNKRIIELNAINNILELKIDSLQTNKENYVSVDSSFYSFEISFSVLNFKNKEYSVFITDPNLYNISLFNIDSQTKAVYDFKTIDQKLKSQNKTLIFAMNAGMYLANRTPQGLYISEGVKYTEVDTNILTGTGNFYDLPPNGIFMIDKNNQAKVITTNEYRNFDSIQDNNIKLATQSGPMLLIDGTMNTNFTKNSTNLNIRNGVGVMDNGNVIFIISNEQVNFYEFSELFAYLNCRNALYLDGAISRMVAPYFMNQNFPNSNHLGPIIAVYK